MFRIIDLGPDGSVSSSQSDDRVTPPPAGVTRWIDLAEQDEAQLAQLAQRFDFHPLTIEDCSHFNQRPKFEEYDDYVFIVIHGLHWPSGQLAQLEVLDLHMFLGSGYLVTVQDRPLKAVESVWRRVERGKERARHTPDFLAYLISDALVDASFPLLDDVAEEVDRIEDEVLTHPSRAQLADIFRLRRVLVRLRRETMPQWEVFELLAKRGSEHVSERTALYFRDVQDHMLRLNDAVEVTRDVLTGTLDAYLRGSSQRTNEIVKRLTLLTAIFLPLAFITGFFGQNFEALPFESELLFTVMLASCAIVPLGMLWFFLRSKWL